MVSCLGSVKLQMEFSNLDQGYACQRGLRPDAPEGVKMVDCADEPKRRTRTEVCSDGFLTTI